MDTVIGLIELLAIAAVVIGIRRRRVSRRHNGVGAPPSRPNAPPARSRAGPSAPSGARRPGADRAIEGWLIGHAVRQGHRDFPGDPLPGGHLGSARDVAFWGGIPDDDDDDDDNADDSADNDLDDADADGDNW